MSPVAIREAALVLVTMLLSLTVHEFAHAWAARRLGDDTAERLGRLTLNPIAHIDWIGTVILPLFLVLSGSGVFFGWAKPVPFTPMRFTRRISMRTGIMLTAAAGPLSNLIVAFLAMSGLAVLVHTGLGAEDPAVKAFIARMVSLNLALAIFNMIPVYPLDGQKVLTGLLPVETAMRYERFNVRYGSVLLLVVIVAGGRVIQIPWLLMIYGAASLFGVPLSDFAG
jgi:Zn-dependent protease